MADTIGLMGVSSLCTLGRPYICGAEEYRGVGNHRASHPCGPPCRRVKDACKLVLHLHRLITSQGAVLPVLED